MTITTTTSLAAFCVLLFSLAGLGEARRVGCNSYSDSGSSLSTADASTGSALSGNEASISADYADSRWLQQDALQWPSRISARLSAGNVHAQLGTTTRDSNSLGKRASKTYPRDLDMRPTPEPTGASSTTTTVHITDEHDFALLLPNQPGGACPRPFLTRYLTVCALSVSCVRLTRGRVNRTRLGRGERWGRVLHAW